MRKPRASKQETRGSLATADRLGDYTTDACSDFRKGFALGVWWSRSRCSSPSHRAKHLARPRWTGSLIRWFAG